MTHPFKSNLIAVGRNHVWFPAVECLAGLSLRVKVRCVVAAFDVLHAVVPLAASVAYPVEAQVHRLGPRLLAGVVGERDGYCIVRDDLGG